ncbi:MAG: glycosyltransferase family 2 protein [Hymenobacteraceae bacterium]|nr:glycosyltransferase family 2 protein [Hymenobacteraceae bacterium]MDX5396396.1 glycosyltransferase family 2 protein [Hymenobacteraceae bacterium]MDX5443336.1 glycosyltransferase family 2 protein [Hymenobacteraceae bacterium]MDX5512458.1 glycosyltransferase family 2 protein [Hymenobacteraceae bacterium]
MAEKLTVLIPCYNEKQTLLQLLQRVENADIGAVEKEIILIDDFSTDSTRELLQQQVEPKHKVIYNKQNRGKGYSIRQGLAAATGSIIIIQDADLEYNPDNYADLLAPILKGEVQVVYGSRIRNKNNKRHSGYSFYLGGLFLSKLTNLLYGSSLTDEPTCYKVFRTEVLKPIKLHCEGFEFCPEVTAKVLKQGIKIVEVPIDYFPRKVTEGKKIRWRDGVEAIWTLVKYRF